MRKFADGILGMVNPGLLLPLVILCIAALAGWLFGGRGDSGDMVLMGMAVLAQGNTLQDILKWEESNLFSREAVTVALGQNLALGAVIGRVTKSTPATGTPGTNTGNGTCTLVAAGPKTKLGTYMLTALSQTAFAVRDPDGLALPDATVGTAYVNAGINFTITAGGTAFAAGDTFAIEVVAGSGQVEAIDFAAVDGTQDAFGFVIAPYDATGAAVPGVAVVRHAVIVAADLVWPAGATADQKAAALARLKEKGIVEADEV